MSGQRPEKDAVNKIFGDELPRTSSDERGIDTAAEEGSREQWLRDNVPPHNV